MILTVLANAIVTGIIVYRLQKKMEITYAKQMEEFRANLQYSIFEQQTKFAYIHAKRVEALETLYSKFAIFGETVTHLIVKMEHSVQKLPEKNPVNLREIENELGLKYQDFTAYFMSIRLFLPEDFVEAVHNVIRTSAFIHKTLWSMIDMGVFHMSYKAVKQPTAIDRA